MCAIKKKMNARRRDAKQKNKNPEKEEKNTHEQTNQFVK